MTQTYRNASDVARELNDTPAEIIEYLEDIEGYLCAFDLLKCGTHGLQLRYRSVVPSEVFKFAPVHGLEVTSVAEDMFGDDHDLLVDLRVEANR